MVNLKDCKPRYMIIPPILCLDLLLKMGEAGKGHTASPSSILPIKYSVF
jgi:hypothetical protein